MKASASELLRSLADSVKDLLPIVAVIAFFQLLVLGQPIPNFLELLWGTLLVVVGLTLFVQGLKLGLFPIGENMARDFASKGSVLWLLLFAFALGFGTTVAEPALIAVAEEAADVAAQGGMIVNEESARESYAEGCGTRSPYPLGWPSSSEFCASCADGRSSISSSAATSAWWS